MKTQYNVNDIVYYIDNYRVVKSVIKEVIIKTDKEGTSVIYKIVDYRTINSSKQKEFISIQARLVDNISIAKVSALTNWKNLAKEVEYQLENLTDSSFEPVKIEEQSNDK